MNSTEDTNGKIQSERPPKRILTYLAILIMILLCLSKLRRQRQRATFPAI